MSPTDDAKLVVESGLGPQQFQTVVAVPTDSWKAAVRLATAYIEAGSVDGGGCLTCGGCGSVDYGGFTPYGSPIDVPCPDCGTEHKDRQIANLTARLATVSSDLAEHKRRLMEQSALLNAVRQELDDLKRKAGGE